MPEKEIEIIGKVFLVMGVLSGIIMIFTKVNYGGYKEFSMFNVSCGLSLILLSAFICGLCNCIGEILENSKEQTSLLKTIIRKLNDKEN